MSTITVEHIVIALFANGSGCRGIMARSAAEFVVKLFTAGSLVDSNRKLCACRLGYSPDSIKTSAQKKLQGDQEVEGHRKKVTVKC